MIEYDRMFNFIVMSTRDRQARDWPILFIFVNTYLSPIDTIVWQKFG